MLPPVQDALPYAEQVRRALIRLRDDGSHSEAIVGKTLDGVPLEGHAHAHYIATDEDGDGHLDHATVYAARGFDQADVDALGRLSKIFRRGNRPDVRLVLVGLGAKDEQQFSNVALLQSSRRWRSVTPFVLPRFATRGAGKGARPRDTPEAQLRREARVRGLPEIISVKPMLGYQAKGRPLVRWLEFETRRFNGSAGYGVAGFEIEFAEEVSAFRSRSASGVISAWACLSRCGIELIVVRRVIQIASRKCAGNFARRLSGFASSQTLNQLA